MDVITTIGGIILYFIIMTTYIKAKNHEIDENEKDIIVNKILKKRLKRKAIIITTIYLFTLLFQYFCLQ